MSAMKNQILKAANETKQHHLVIAE